MQSVVTVCYFMKTATDHKTALYGLCRSVVNAVNCNDRCSTSVVWSVVSYITYFQNKNYKIFEKLVLSCLTGAVCFVVCFHGGQYVALWAKLFTVLQLNLLVVKMERKFVCRTCFTVCGTNDGAVHLTEQVNLSSRLKYAQSILANVLPELVSWQNYILPQHTLANLVLNFSTSTLLLTLYYAVSAGLQ